MTSTNTERPLFHRGGDYQSHRPDYPAALFQWLAQHSPGHRLALDLGCGSGQACRAKPLQELCTSLINVESLWYFFIHC